METWWMAGLAKGRDGRQGSSWLQKISCDGKKLQG